MIREELEDYPPSSVREALINAIIHRDYQILGSEIHIDIYPDRLEITSPGGMTDGSKIQALNIAEIPSMRRNKVLSDIFRRLHIMERRGNGLTRILEGYDDVEAKPEFYSDISYFRVTMPNKRNAKETVIASPVRHLSPLLSKNEEKILEYIKQNPEITQKELADILGISDRQIRKTILLLKENNIIIRVGSSRKGYWKLETQ